MEKVGLGRWVLSLATLALAFVGGIAIAMRWTEVVEYQAAAGFAGLACAFYARHLEWQAGFQVGRNAGGN